LPLARSSLMCLGAGSSHLRPPAASYFFNGCVAKDGPEFKELIESGLAPFAAVARIDKPR
jgi:hypothetical protein